MASPSSEIVPATQLPNAVAVLFTSPLGTITRLEKVTYQNTAAAPHQVTVYLVPVGGTPGVSNVITNAQTISGKQTLNDVNIPGHYLNAGDTIQAFADSAATVNIFVGGTQLT